MGSLSLRYMVVSICLVWCHVMRWLAFGSVSISHQTNPALSQSNAMKSKWLWFTVV